MSDFSGFSDAARLYAENVKLVSAMQEIFEREVNHLLDVLAERIQRLVHPSPLQDQKTPGYRYWWIGQRPGESRERHPRIWFVPKSPEIVTEGRLILQVNASESVLEVVAAIKQIASNPDFSDFCSQAKSRWSLVQAAVKVMSSDDIDLVWPAESPSFSRNSSD